ncbi:hypothetical protein ACIBBE_24250 [Streptomyces sp. NPDC051644]|uniref:hypothetical protein n=1 Tax=Streptomyces sp. NPDC051644 TaxID=3365666 RepID=UPI0037A838EC
MNLAAFKFITSQQNRPPTLSRHELSGPDRTLTLGYTCDKDSWHVYLQGDQIHLLIYNAVSRTLLRHEARATWEIADLVPDKRLYPESTNPAFARRLIDRGQRLRFTSFDETRYARFEGVSFHGPTHSDGSLTGIGHRPTD